MVALTADLTVARSAQKMAHLSERATELPMALKSAKSEASSAVLMGCSMVDLKVALTVELLAVLLVTLKVDQ